jgi:hypothetical protein
VDTTLLLPCPQMPMYVSSGHVAHSGQTWSEACREVPVHLLCHTDLASVGLCVQQESNNELLPGQVRSNRARLALHASQGKVQAACRAATRDVLSNRAPGTLPALAIVVSFCPRASAHAGLVEPGKETGVFHCNQYAAKNDF